MPHIKKSRSQSGRNKKNKSRIVLVSGGARSGKSSFAQSLAKFAKTPFYVATAWSGDEEMKKRIEKHQRERGNKWSTIEERTSISNAIQKAIERGADFIVVDCLTLWLSNIFMQKLSWHKQLNELKKYLRQNPPPATVIFVTNEVGCGIVPADKISREFRDAAGIINQQIASLCDEVYLCSCGIPIRLRPS